MERRAARREHGHASFTPAADWRGCETCATVHLAEDLRHRRPVAIKVLRPDLGVSLGAERFLREIRIAAQLQHPHIVPVFDSGGDGGLLWYAMPLIEGETLLARKARRSALGSPARVVSLSPRPSASRAR